MLRYFISTFCLLMSLVALAQNDSIISTTNDSLKIEQRYGLRLGGDISKLLRTVLDDDYKGFEINADFRLNKRWYVAGELGTEEKTTSNDFLNVTSKGSYFKAGVDYNMYQNWFGMENMIYAGFRAGASTFSQTLNSFSIYNTDQYWQQQLSSDVAQEFNNLTALWGELIIGIKAELLTNLYIGLNVQLKGMISQDEPTNFENIYVPGFNKTYDSGRFGAGYGYTISYIIPIYKKAK